MAEETSDDEYVGSEDASRSSNSDTESEGSRSSSHAPSSRAHSTQLGSRENVATQKRSIPQSRELVDESDEMVDSSQGQTSERKSRSRQSSKRKPSKSERQQSRSAQSKQPVDAMLTREYQILFNNMVEGISNYSSESTYLKSSQIGSSIWTSNEKLALFRSLSKSGSGDLPRLAQAVLTKSEAEIQTYLSLLLLEATASSRRDNAVPFKDTPIAFEISSRCEENLDAAAEALATRLEEHESAVQREKFGDQWLIDEATAENEDQQYHDSLNTAQDAANSEAQSVPSPPDANDRSSSEIAALLRPAALLDLSRTLFMNNGEHDHLNWQHIESITDASATPAIYRSALNDLQTIVVILTRHMVQLCIHQANTRLRAGDSSRTDWTPLAVVRETDVLSAVQMRGMNSSSRHYWADVANRCGVAVYSDSKKYRDGRPGTKVGVRLTQDEVRAELDPSHSDLSRIEDDDERKVLEEDLMEDDELFTDESASLNSEEESCSEEDGDAPSSSSRKRKRALSPASLHRRADAYLEACDQKESALEERRLYEALHLETSSGIERIVPEQLVPRGQESIVQQPWRDAIDYESDWEHPLGCPGKRSFEAMESRGILAEKRRLRLAQKVRHASQSPTAD